jgi:hypothetical protein
MVNLSAEDAANFPKLYKSIPQGAATTVWAALNPEAKGFCADCAVGQLRQIKEDGIPVTRSMIAKGYAPWAVDEAAATRLWEESLKMVGL